MRLAVLSDIHGNMEAFLAVLADIDRAGVDRIVSLGDNIGYGAESEPVMALIRERGIPSILGNHELAVKSPRFSRWFNPLVRSSLEATFSGLSERTVGQIQKMELFRVAWRCRFVHGFPPRSPFLYLYQMSERKIRRAFEKFDERRCFIGHTHDLALVGVTEAAAFRLPFTRGSFPLDDDRKYLVNVGAVGQPRDGDSRAKYVIWDSDRASLEVRFVEYDIEAAARKILDAGLPESFAARLR